MGTAILESGIYKIFPAHSLLLVLWKSWILSIVCSASIGFSVWHRWRNNAAKWTWVPAAVWLGFRVVLAIPNEPICRLALIFVNNRLEKIAWLKSGCASPARLLAG